MDNQTQCRVCLYLVFWLLYFTAQFGILTALVLQKTRLRELYDLRDNYDEHSGSVNDLQNGFAITEHIRLFISVMVFGSLRQFFTWAGLLCLACLGMVGLGPYLLHTFFALFRHGNSVTTEGSRLSNGEEGESKERSKRSEKRFKRQISEHIEKQIKEGKLSTASYPLVLRLLDILYIVLCMVIHFKYSGSQSDGPAVLGYVCGLVSHLAAASVTCITFKELQRRTCMFAQIGSLFALILQSIRVSEVYELRKFSGDSGMDTTTGINTMTHFAIFVVIITLGFIKQPLVWSGLIRQDVLHLGFSVFIDIVNTITCLGIIPMFGGRSIISAVPGVTFGLLSMLTTAYIINTACQKEMIPTEEPEEDKPKVRVEVTPA